MSTKEKSGTAGIFISYRIDDTQHVASRLAADLNGVFETDIFIDLESVQAGGRWGAEIRSAAAGCSAMLVLIGDRWLKVQNEFGERRLDLDGDWVRQECALGLEKGTLIPILVEGAAPISDMALQRIPSLASLPGLQALELRCRDWGSDFEAIVRAVEQRGLERRRATPATKIRSIPATSKTQVGADGPAIPVQQLTGMEFAAVPAGKFRMGSGDTEDEQPEHEVEVSEFWLARTPVTNRQYEQFLVSTSHEEPDFWRDPKWNGAEQPVVGVSWEDAAAFCEWAGLRLPSEAEWEYACRAGASARYWFGDEESGLADAGWYEDNAEGATKPVAQKLANPWGLHDVHGNVWEWCQDVWHESYEGAPADGSAWDEGSGNRVLRGGSWRNPAWRSRSAYRINWHPGVRLNLVGFRPATSVQTG